MHPNLAHRSTALWVTVLGLIICLGVPAFSQSTSGRIVGRTADPSGAVLAGVKITLVNEATGANRSTQSNTNGDYNFVEVVPGSYRVEYEITGFKKNVQTGVLVDVNQVVTLNSILQVGATQEVIEVTSEAPQVDTTSTQLGAVINDRSVNELPLNTRDTYQFLQLQPLHHVDVDQHQAAQDADTCQKEHRRHNDPLGLDGARQGHNLVVHLHRLRPLTPSPSVAESPTTARLQRPTSATNRRAEQGFECA